MIRFETVSFRYRANEAENALKDIRLHISQGQVVLLSGPSGCGKSTILRLINGLAPHYYEGELSGEVSVAGKVPSQCELYELAETVGTVFQNPRSQFFNVDTTSELAFGCENQGMPVREILMRVEKTVERFDISSLMNRSLFALSGGQKQKIACASIDVPDLPVILMDEPSANLDADATMQLKKVIGLWKEAGKTILIAEHRISYLWDLADRVILMDSGKIMQDLRNGEHRALTEAGRVQAGLRALRWETPLDVVLSETAAQEYIELKNLSFAYEKKNRIWSFENLRIPKKRIAAICGANGTGKTTLLHCLAGMERHMEGEFWDGGCKLPRKEIFKRCFLVMQDVNHQLFSESVLDEVLISMPDEDEKKAHEILRLLDLENVSDRHPMSLSGGQKQRVAVACAFASNRDILLFDEPTSGLDYGHMQMTAALLKQLKAIGKTLLVATHDSELIHICCDSIVTIGGDLE